MFNAQAVVARLNELADVYGARHLSEGAAKVWCDTLDKFTTDAVLFVLVDIPKRVSKMPTPAEVFKAVSERASKSIEARAAANNQAAGFTLDSFTPHSAVGRRELAKQKTIVAAPPPGRREWANNPKSEGARRLAREIRRERTPIDDDRPWEPKRDDERPSERKVDEPYALLDEREPGCDDE